ncbi:hypothetical protein AMS60_16635 [Bacillus sp. FJAT-21945]|nr:hypothetical protein AMS60_16635 [Bacillus sp. FJAT-21945]
MGYLCPKEGQKNILKSEIKQDNNIGVNIERKQNMLIELEEKIKTVQEQVQEKLTEQLDNDENKHEEDNNETSEDENNQ